MTFSLLHVMWADTIYLVGEFNKWNGSSHSFRVSREDSWTLTIDLEGGRFCQIHKRILKHGNRILI